MKTMTMEPAHHSITAPVSVNTARPAALTNETLREAVQLWHTDRAAATARYGSIGTWDTSGVTEMRGLFEGQKSFNDYIGDWDVSKVESMRRMFHGATAFNQPLENWNVCKVKDCSGMFDGAVSFDKPLGKWDVSHVRSMNGMFAGAASFNQPLQHWVVINVKEHRYESPPTGPTVL